MIKAKIIIFYKTFEAERGTPLIILVLPFSINYLFMIHLKTQIMNILRNEVIIGNACSYVACILYKFPNKHFG